MHNLTGTLVSCKLEGNVALLNDVGMRSLAGKLCCAGFVCVLSGSGFPSTVGN